MATYFFNGSGTVHVGDAEVRFRATTKFEAESDDEAKQKVAQLVKDTFVTWGEIDTTKEYQLIYQTKRQIINHNVH